MFSTKSVYITVQDESLNTILCVLASMIRVALRRITAQYQIQISDENTCIHSYTAGLGSSTVDQVLKYTKYPKYIPSTSTGQVLIFLKST